MDSKQQFGIGRVPADVDPTSEAMANIRAAEITARMGTGYREPVRPSGRCAQCGRPGTWVPGAGQFLCERDEDNY